MKRENKNKVHHQWSWHKVGQRERILYWIIQENLIENSIQHSLPYILITHDPCSTTFAYPK